MGWSRGGRQGIGLRGGRWAIDASGGSASAADLANATPDIHAYRILGRSAIGATTGIYQDRLDAVPQIMWSRSAAVAILPAVPAAAGMLYALPFLVGARRKIYDVYNTQCSGSGVGNPELRWAVYSNISHGIFYPGALLAESASIALPAANTRFGPWSPNLLLAPGMYWAVHNHNAEVLTQTRALKACEALSLQPFGGWPAALPVTEGGSDDFPRCGWSHAQAYGAMPATFPTATPIGLRMVAALYFPMFFVRWGT